MKLKLSYKTSAGMFFIGKDADGYRPIYNYVLFGPYDSKLDAVEAIANNDTWSVFHSETGELLDTSELGLPDDPSDWDSDCSMY